MHDLNRKQKTKTLEDLKNRSANAVWSHFLTVCSIPHPSHHETLLTDWILKWASLKNIECKMDEIGNLIFNKPATEGFEGSTAVILQAHLDMVPQKNNNSSHNFVTDPIEPLITDGWLHANDTTLGADNGIGMAACLAVLEDSTIKHGPLEVLLTTNEETGMVGAFGLKGDALKGEILINTDSEQEGELYIGCAGGVDVNAQLAIETLPIETLLTENSPLGNESNSKNEMYALKISLTGLLGGHSGCDINLGRGNAIIILADLLQQLDSEESTETFSLAKFEGGSLRNAIPREASAIIVCNLSEKAVISLKTSQYQDRLTAKFTDIEPGINLQIETVETPDELLTPSSKNRLITSVSACPNGIFSMDKNFENVPQTSNNLGILTQNKETITMQVLVRSQVDSEKEQLSKNLVSHFEKHGAKVVVSGNYPGWEPNKKSSIYNVVEKQYQNIFGSTPKAMVIHAGLECGLFSSLYPQWDMISIGPTINYPHSPAEKVEIASVDKFWTLLVATLEHIE